MKKLFKLLSGVAFVFLLSLTLSSFTNIEPVENNGVDVEVVKDGMRWYIVGCDFTPVYAKQSKDQYKNGNLHMSTYNFNVPDCYTYPSKAERVDIAPGIWYIYTPSGKLILKEIHN